MLSGHLWKLPRPSVAILGGRRRLLLSCLILVLGLVGAASVLADTPFNLSAGLNICNADVTPSTPPGAPACSSVTASTPDWSSIFAFNGTVTSPRSPLPSGFQAPVFVRDFL